MEINSNSRHNALNNTEIINTDIIRSYQDLQDKLKDNLTDSFMSVFIQMFNKLSNEERKYFNEDADKNLNVNWVININTVANNRGDLSTSSMQKVFHSLFIKEKEPDSEFDTNFCKFKKDFIDLLYCKFTVVLNSQTDQISNEYVERYEIKNGFLNIYLKGKGLQLLQEEKDYKKPSKQLENNFCFSPIGYLESCFPEKFSVPRQGNLLKLTRAKINFVKTVDSSAFDGLEHFDYIWIIYVFHLNQNFNKAKISPPKYEGNKLGVYATRTPHRFNPIGLTLAKIEKIEKNEIFISSVDMISGTPIIDIKPYHHLESIDMSTAKYPEWIKHKASEDLKANVIISDIAISNLKSILNSHKLIFYEKEEDILELIRGILEIDPHSKYTQKKKETLLYAFYVDKLNVIYEYNAERKEVLVLDIEFSEDYKKLRNKSWLDNFIDKI